jgi:hypothetical protein
LKLTQYGTQGAQRAVEEITERWNPRSGSGRSVHVFKELDEKDAEGFDGTAWDKNVDKHRSEKH